MDLVERALKQVEDVLAAQIAAIYQSRDKSPQGHIQNEAIMVKARDDLKVLAESHDIPDLAMYAFVITCSVIKMVLNVGKHPKHNASMN